MLQAFVDNLPSVPARQSVTLDLFGLIVMRRFLISCVLVFVVGQSVHSAYADLAFTDLVGDWTASGQVVAHPNAPLERSRCRVTVSADIGGSALSVTGRCAIAAGATDVTMHIVDNDDGTVRATVTLSNLDGNIELTGARNGDVISLRTQAALLFEGEHYWSRLDITLDDATRFSLKEWTAVQSTSDWQLSRDLLFERQAATE
jgi:hypothetical protein